MWDVLKAVQLLTPKCHENTIGEFDNPKYAAWLVDKPGSQLEPGFFYA